MKEMSIDIETYSSVDLIHCGVYAYVNAPDFEILLFAYAFDDEEIQIVETVGGQGLPTVIMEALTSPDVIKTAYNANFERTCIQKHFGIRLPVEQWRCSAVAAAQLGLPHSLAGVAQSLGLEQQKDSQGTALIKYFSIPCKPTAANGQRKRNLPGHNPEKWEAFKKYCIQDVAVERAIKKRISRFSLHEREQRLWENDQRMNDRGVGVDLELVGNAIRFSKTFDQRCVEQAKELTGVENVKSVAQLKGWLEKETGQKITSLNKDNLQDLITSTDNEVVLQVLKLRSNMAKTSVAKYEAMERSVCPDGRIRGMLQFYGANRTGRWAGRLVQLQNLPQNHLKDLDMARKLLAEGDYELFELIYDNIPQTLSELIRTAFVASPGNRLIVSDFSAIEARVIAYLADEHWRMEVFRTHGKIYEASAAQMFHVPVDSIKKGDPLRQKGKIAELALGYGGGKGALTSMGALKMGLIEEELQPLVNVWRQANPHIVQFWRDVEKAALNAVRDRPTTLGHGLHFQKEAGVLFIGLPSGRKIAYVQPQIGVGRFGNPALTYMGMNQSTKKWERIETFGGKLVENIVQAFARDCLAEGLLRLEEKGLGVVFHVHDEVVLETPKGISSVDQVSDILCEEISWAPGLPLKAEGYECTYYKKD